MANYNTRGTKHQTERGDYDCIFNKGYCWHRLFDDIVAKLISSTGGIVLAKHVQDYEKKDNREYSLSEINEDALRSGEVVEIEAETLKYKNTQYGAIRKAVIRLPERKDGEQIVVVVDFSRGNKFIKTAWLNKANDNHQRGLDTGSLDWDYIGKFGYELNGADYVYEIREPGKEYFEFK